MIGFGVEEEILEAQLQFLWKLIRLVSGLFFAVTCVVGFIALMILNLVLCERYFPGILETAEHSAQGKGRAVLQIFISRPIPVIVCFGLYKIFNWIDGKLKKASSSNQGH